MVALAFNESSTRESSDPNRNNKKTPYLDTFHAVSFSSMKAILHINSSNQGFSYWARVSVVKPGFQLLNQGFSQFAHWFFKLRFQLLNPGFKLKSEIKFMNPVLLVEN